MKNNVSLKKSFPYFLALVFFVALFITGLMIYKDFGVPFDEPYLIQLAIMNHIYIFKGNPALLTEFYRYYGMVFELPLFWVASRFAGPDTVYIRHLLLFLAFFASLVIFYLLSLRLFRNPWWGLLAVSMLAMSPRIFSDAFYNSKDIAFMDVFILAIWTLTLAIDAIGEKWLTTSTHVFTHSLTSSLLIGTRIVGVMIIPISILLLAIEGIRSKLSWKNLSIIVLSYLILTAGLTILFWPVLWHDPYQEFVNAFRQMSKFEIYGKAVLFQGEFIPSDALPWDYLPVWIGISTPIIVLVGFVIGMGNWIKSVLIFSCSKKDNWVTKQKEWISGSDTLHWLAIISWLAIPIFSLYIFDSVIYNSWRHLFFIYPAIVLFAVRGYSSLHKWFSELTGRQAVVTILTVLILLIGLAEPIGFLSRDYRYGIVYFNQLAGDPKTLRQRYELDYQGVSFKEAIDYILATDQSDSIPIYLADVSGLNYINSALTKEQKSRFVILDSPDKGARYFIGNFSFYPKEYQYSQSSLEYYSIIVRGMKIIVVYQFH